MTLRPSRVRGLLKAKKRMQHELPGITVGELGKWLCDDRQPDLGDLKRLAEALDATSDYLIGLGDDYRAGGETDNYAFAAAKMSFDYFRRSPATSLEQQRRCHRVWSDDELMMREGAPMTAEQWKSLAEMIDRAVPIPPKIGAAKGA